MAFHQINGVRIRTNYDYPPIPIRQFDWSAIDDDSYDGADDSSCPIGHGATEQHAIDDLLEQLDVEECSRCKGSGLIGVRNRYPMSYVGPGPVPEDARGVCEVTCDECKGTGYLETET